MKTITLKKDYDSVIEYINSLTDEEKVRLHNDFCRNCNYPDNEIYINDEEFFNTFFSNNVIEAVRAVSYGEYNYCHEYVMFDGYGNLQSFNYPDEYIFSPDIASDILENPENYDIDLEEEETEEENS